MKLSILYLKGQNGHTKAVQIPIAQWERMLAKMKEYEQTLMVESDLKEAYAQVAAMVQKGGKKETLSEFLNGC